MIIAVLGSGAWGTALAKMLAEKHDDVRLWFHDQEACFETKRTHINPYLVKIKLPTNLKLETDLAKALPGAEIVILATPAQNLKPVLKKAKKYLSSKAIIINAAKGIEIDSFGLISEIIDEVLPEFSNNAVFLSGPSFAAEVALKKETAVVLASKSAVAARKAQVALSMNYFRPYTSRDVVGVQVAGAYKNVLAIAAGVLSGLGKGENLQAALLARGLKEMTRFGKTFGAKENTFLGLAGVGDLVLTARSEKSRNFSFGREIGRGRLAKDVIKNSNAIVEGYYTVKAIIKKAKKLGLNLTIANSVYNILYENYEPETAVRDIMLRGLKEE
ncbi:MAG: NAD(P)-dependent glycerol-3-phosphate dehydrogenase [Patescibacteria group bacterium]|nr:NAD(P)-dependent glycerol-3-phosphate dehydrogenase [Patescibacteria group bacterium]